MSTPSNISSKKEPIQNSWWSHLSPTQRNVISWTAIGLGVSTLGVIVYKVSQNVIREVGAKKQENKSFGSSPHATWAKQLKMAFDNDGWWGTDVKAVRRVLLDIPSKHDFQKVMHSYKVANKGDSLIKDLTDELKASEFDEMLAILSSKPKKASQGEGPIYDPYSWARRLHSAVNIYYGPFPGTDEDAILKVFAELPSKKAFMDTASAYLDLYNIPLAKDLDDDLNWSIDWRKLIKS